MNYWRYISKQRGIKFGGVVIAGMLLFYLAGFFMPGIDSLIELKYLAFIIGIPVAIFFIGNYVAYKKLKK